MQQNPSVGSVGTAVIQAGMPAPISGLDIVRAPSQDIAKDIGPTAKRAKTWKAITEVVGMKRQQR